MSEVTFAKSFLATLDKRPIKLPADHVSDPRKYPNQSPVRLQLNGSDHDTNSRLQFILPKQTHPFPRTDQPTATQQAKATTITATLKPMRSGESVTLTDITLDTSIHDLKTQYAQQTSQPLDKVKLLLNRKPAADLKTLKELGVHEDVELTVMVMGGASGTPAATSPATEKTEPPLPAAVPLDRGAKMDIDTPAPQSEKAPVEVEGTKTTGMTTDGILETQEFWTDLQGFLAQRIRDESEGEKLAGVFRRAWQKR